MTLDPWGPLLCLFQPITRGMPCSQSLEHTLSSHTHPGQHPSLWFSPHLCLSLPASLPLNVAKGKLTSSWLASYGHELRVGAWYFPGPGPLLFSSLIVSHSLPCLPICLRCAHLSILILKVSLLSLSLRKLEPSRGSSHRLTPPSAPHLPSSVSTYSALCSGLPMKHLCLHLKWDPPLPGPVAPPTLNTQTYHSSDSPSVLPVFSVYQIILVGLHTCYFSFLGKHSLCNWLLPLALSHFSVFLYTKTAKESWLSSLTVHKFPRPILCYPTLPAADGQLSFTNSTSNCPMIRERLHLTELKGCSHSHPSCSISTIWLRQSAPLPRYSLFPKSGGYIHKCLLHPW